MRREVADDVDLEGPVAGLRRDLGRRLEPGESAGRIFVDVVQQDCPVVLDPGTQYLFAVLGRRAVRGLSRGAVVCPGVAPEQHYGDLPGLVRTAALAQPVDGSVPDSVHRLLRDYPPEG